MKVKKSPLRVKPAWKPVEPDEDMALPAPAFGSGPNAPAPVIAELPGDATFDRGSTQATYRYLLSQFAFDQQPQSWDAANALLRRASDMAAAYRIRKSGIKRRGVGTTTESMFETPAHCSACGRAIARGQTTCADHAGTREVQIGEGLIKSVADDEG